MSSGIISIYKEKGYTSFDVVAILRKKFKIRKIGHTGTLDPDAEGVLPICVGNATKVVDLLTDKDKVYLAKMTLGMTTDTQDHTGKVLLTRAVTCSKSEIESAIMSFVGPYSQLPPMYSAIKINGQKLYDLARQGIEVERVPRNIVIHQISNLKWESEYEISFEVNCSKGTYIRTLCYDIGEKLGCGAHMSGLTRLQVGPFLLSESYKLSEINEENDDWKSLLLPVDRLFLDYLAVEVSTDYDKYIRNGNVLRWDMLIMAPVPIEGQVMRVYDGNHVFIGLYETLRKEEPTSESEANVLWLLKPIKLFL